ncbi:hypothetical protein BH10PSE13_BH10PSE13_18670 [soil metagenome]
MADIDRGEMMRNGGVLKIVGLAAVLMLAGCSGVHSLPPPTFASTDGGDDRIVKVAFDQYGAIYPDAGTTGLPLPPAEMARQGDFGLRRYYAGLGLPYDQAAIRAHVVGLVKQAMARHQADRLVILIRGFNNSYEATEEGFDFLRERIAALAPDPDRVLLEVYWDAYTSGTVATPLVATTFLSAIGSSNLAGQCGLRPLLALMPDQSDVTFVTHSRGAAVALSVATDPPDDEGRRAERCMPIPPSPTGLGDVALVAFAPAVGDGLVRKDDRVPADLFQFFDHIYIAFNHEDEQTSKTMLGIRLGGSILGDTRLASDERYRDQVEAQSGGLMGHETFTNKRHAIGAYFAAEQQSQCLLWAGRLRELEPAGCHVKR